MRTVEKSRETDLASVGTVCNRLQLNRDAYYKTRVRLIEQKKTEEKVISLVKKERESQPRVGTMKLQKHLAHEFLKLGIKMGRDRLFDVLRANDMLVKRKKASFKTTNSYHHFHKYNNIDQGLGDNKTRSGVGIGYNLYQNSKRLLLFGFDNRFIFKENRRI